MKKVILFAAVISALLINACGGGGSDGSNALYPPALPTDLAVLECTESDVTIQWTDNADNESGYEIERSVNGGDYAPVAQTVADETEFSESLADNTIYKYRVRAYNSAGDSDYSNEAAIKRSRSAIADIDAEIGGTIHLNGLATLTFPAESLSSDQEVIAVEGVKEDSLPEDKAPYLDIVSDIKPLSIVDFSLGDVGVNNNFRLVMSYDPAILEQINSRDADGIAELVSRGVITQADADRRLVTSADLDIYYFNTITLKWVKTTAVINTAEHTLTLYTPYLGIYCVGYSMAEKTGYSLEANPDIQQFIIDSLNNPEEIYGDSSESSKSTDTCPYSCGSRSSSVKLKAIEIMSGYHSGCTRCPSSMDVDKDGDLDGSIPGDGSHATLELGCDYCSTPNDVVDALSGYIFKPACANHDCCYRHGYAAYGYKKWPCDKRFLGEMISIGEDKYPLFGKTSFKLTPWGPRITIKYPKPWNLLLRAEALFLAGVMFHNAELLSLVDTVAAYSNQPCFDYYKKGVDCGVPVLHDLKISGDGKSWCESGQSIVVESSIYNIDGRHLEYTWSSGTGTFNDYSSASVTWTAPETIDNDTEVVITCTINDGVNNIPAKSITVKVFKPYTITYDANTADSGSVPDQQTHLYYGTAVTLALNSGSLVKSELNFGGWNTAADASGLDRPVGSFYIMGKGDVTLYAKWTLYPVIYNGNGNTGGSTPVDITNYQFGETVTLLGPGDLARDNYTFGFWDTAYDGSGINYFPGDTFTFGSDVTLYAKWLWTRLSGYSGKDTWGFGIAVDSEGNSYITGITYGNLDGQTLTGTNDVFIIKYNSSGAKQWTRLLGTSGEFKGGWGIAVDSSGNSYVTGYTGSNLDGQTLTGSYDVFVTKYDSSGVKQWTRLSGVSGKSTTGYGVTIDSVGCIYITGQTSGNLDGEILTGGADVFVIKYDSSGAKQWTRLSGVSGRNTPGRGIAVDSEGNSYITGRTGGNLDGETVTGNQDVFVIKYNSSGVKQWTRLLGASGVQTWGNGISVDSDGNSYVTGFTGGDLDGQTVTGTQDVFVIKYDSSGVKQWTRLLGASGVQTCGNSIVVDSDGNSYVTGYTSGNLDGETLTGSQDVFVIKYDSMGTKQWTKLLGTNGKNTLGYGIAIDSSGNSYVTGYTFGNLDGQTLTGPDDTFVTTIFNK